MRTDAQLAVEAAEAGAATVRAQFGQQLARFDKEPLDFATQADIEAEQAVLKIIERHRPDDGFLGEESGHHKPEADRTWLVDPLCGTINFAARTRLVAVNVALQQRGQTLAAAAADPFTGETFWTDGQSAHLNDQNVTPSQESRLVEVDLDNAKDFDPIDFLKSPEFGTSYLPRVTSTTLALAWTADGRRAAYVTTGKLEDSVHFTAGIALCRAAGCVVTNLRGGPLHTGAGGLLAAADEQTHADLTRMIARQY